MRLNKKNALINKKEKRKGEPFLSGNNTNEAAEQQSNLFIPQAFFLSNPFRRMIYPRIPAKTCNKSKQNLCVTESFDCIYLRNRSRQRCHYSL